MNLLHDREFYKPLCPKFQSLLVFQRNASLVHHDAGLGLATTLGSDLASTATENHPMCVIEGLGLTYIVRVHRVIVTNKNISS